MNPFDQSDEFEDSPDVAPLFPLPDCVLFPLMVQPLHIFEPRYRDMVSWCLEHDSPFVLCTLLPNHEAVYDTKQAPIRPLGCLSKITIHKQLADGRYMMIVRGLSRVEIVAEAELETPYRVGQLLVLPDRYPEPARVNRAVRRAELLRVFFERFPDLQQNGALGQVLNSELSQGTLCDLLSYSSRSTSEQQYDVLSCLDVDRRSDLVLKQLQAMPVQKSLNGPTASSGSRPFPPPFSLN